MEIRRKDRVISEEETIRVIKNGIYGVLSTIGEDGYPYGVPVNYAFEDGCIYFHCAMGVGHKLKNIDFSDKICFTVVGDIEVLPDEFSMNYQSAVVFGKVVKVAEEEKKPYLMYLIKKYSSEFMKEGTEYVAHCEKASVYKIIPERISGKGRK